MIYNVPNDWKEISHTKHLRGDFPNDPPVYHKQIQGWIKPDGNFISPDKLPPEMLPTPPKLLEPYQPTPIEVSQRPDFNAPARQGHIGWDPSYQSAKQLPDGTRILIDEIANWPKSKYPVMDEVQADKDKIRFLLMAIDDIQRKLPDLSNFWNLTPHKQRTVIRKADAALSISIPTVINTALKIAGTEEALNK